MTTAILTDSTAYLPNTLVEKYNIYTIPLNVLIDGESYQEEKELTAALFYEKVKQLKELPKTSQPAIGAFTSLFEELSNAYDSVICIHLSSGISGTYQAAVTAGQQVEGIQVYPIDSEVSCMPQGFLVLEAAKQALEGIAPEEIVSSITALKKETNAYFLVDDLQHLQKGGRLSSAQAFMGSMLQVKPILHFVDTKIVPYEKIRTRKKAVDRIFQLMQEDINADQPLTITVIHANRPQEAKDYQAQLKNMFPKATVMISYFGAVIGTHLGEGALGFGWCPIIVEEE
ncbi:DegV family protein [Aureibacillus halotolerans]|nr:DegV family protein [Aureibacillus halotolerans]